MSSRSIEQGLYKNKALYSAWIKVGEPWRLAYIGYRARGSPCCAGVLSMVADVSKQQHKMLLFWTRYASDGLTVFNIIGIIVLNDGVDAGEVCYNI